MAAKDSFLNSFESLAVASEWTPMEEARPINVPIYSSSTFKLPTVARGEELSTGKVSETMVHSFYAKKNRFVNIIAEFRLLLASFFRLKVQL